MFLIGLFSILFFQQNINPNPDLFYKNANFEAFINYYLNFLKTRSITDISLKQKIKLANAAKQLNKYELSLNLYKASRSQEIEINDYIEYEMSQIYLLKKDTLSFLKAAMYHTGKYLEFPLREELLLKARDISFIKKDTIFLKNIIAFLPKNNKSISAKNDFYNLKLIKKNDLKEINLNKYLLYFTLYSSNKESSILLEDLTQTIDINKLDADAQKKIWQTALIQKNDSIIDLLYNSYAKLANIDSLEVLKLRYFIHKNQTQNAIDLIEKYKDQYSETQAIEFLRLLPRLYKKMSNEQETYKSYLLFARRFKTQAFAFEAVNYVIDQSEKNLTAYIKLLDEFKDITYPFHDYITFKEIIYYFKNKNFKKALSEIEQAEKITSGRENINALKYWKAKILKILNKKKEANLILTELSKTPFDDYYCIKAWFYQNINFPPDSLKFNDLEIKSNLEKVNNVNILRLNKLAEIYGKSYFLREYSSFLQSSFKLPEVASELIQLANEIQAYQISFRLAYQLKNKWFKTLSVNYLFPQHYREQTDSASLASGVEEEFIRAIMFRESAFQSDAVSAADAHGLVQVVPATAWQISRKYKIAYQNEFDLYNPQKNLLIGSYYMADLLKKYSGNKEAVLAAYNAGPSRSTRWLKELDTSNTDLWIEQIGIEQTRTYIKKVMFAYYAYKLINKNNQNVYLKQF